MKAIVFTSPGGLDVLTQAEFMTPVPGPGQVLIETAAFALNPIDVKTRKGAGVYSLMQDKQPMVLGWDVSGKVVATGEGQTKFKVGDEVFGMVGFPNPGSCYATHVVADAKDLALKPGSVTHAEAAGAALAGLTAWQAMTTLQPLLAGQRILIHAAAGGVGHLAVQLAKALGAYVIATTSDTKVEFVKGLGADEVIDYTRNKFEDYTGAVSMVLDSVGGQKAPRSVDLLKKGGLYISIIGAANEEIQAQAQERGAKAVNFRVYTNEGHIQQIAEQLSDLRLRCYVSKKYTMDQIQAAQHELEQGHTIGKLVVLV